ncbi:helix-turn-helix transcriptional regulator [Cyanobium sp. ATX 6A2]|uniref:ArsR/SmtB family transcription factor n=1 Tax=Cyanobium sp. ATX 6A2 TaxID=2823700 RepID=UPI0037BED464|nr:helix-turn-helix transcriptional regulator [Cyanobium sp. ATX 6A2]
MNGLRDAPAAAATALGTAPALGTEQARPMLKALADPCRLQVLEALAGGERCVCDLTGELGLAQSRLSFHLRVLRDAGLLSDRQSGRWVYYSLRPEALEALQSWLAALARQCTAPATPCCD